MNETKLQIKDKGDEDL